MEVATRKKSWTSKILALEVGETIPTVSYDKHYTIRTLVSGTIALMAPNRVFECKRDGEILTVTRKHDISIGNRL